MSVFNSAEFDIDMLLAKPVESAVQARCERKANSSAVKTPSKGLGSFASSKTPGRSYNDRFIPNRDAMNSDLHNVSNENAVEFSSDFNSKLAQSLFAGDDLNSKILSFKNKAPAPSEGFQNQLRVLYTQNKEAAAAPRAQRHINKTAERILDAPGLVDDFYLNLLDWSSKNLLAVTLGSAVYMWDASTGAINQLCDLANGDDYITSVQWTADGTHLAVGVSNSEVQLWNVEQGRRLRTMKGQAGRVAALAWKDHVLSSGGRQGYLMHSDVRVADHKMAFVKAHEQEICGLKWSQDGQQLASGANDNVVAIWDASACLSAGAAAEQPKFRFTESCAAVKALAWCPSQRNLLAAGGGTADRHIRLYNTQTGVLVNDIDTKSQVSALQWSPRDEKELLSAHGFAQNQLSVWKYPTMARIADLEGHSARILHTAISPDGTTVVSASADETLRFWKVWEPAAAAKKLPLGKAGLTEESGRTRLTMSIR